MSVENIVKYLDSLETIQRIPIGTTKRDTIIEISNRERQRLDHEDVEFLEAFERLDATEKAVVRYLLKKFALLFSRQDEP